MPRSRPVIGSLGASRARARISRARCADRRSARAGPDRFASAIHQRLGQGQQVREARVRRPGHTRRRERGCEPPVGVRAHRPRRSRSRGSRRAPCSAGRGIRPAPVARTPAPPRRAASPQASPARATPARSRRRAGPPRHPWPRAAAPARARSASVLARVEPELPQPRQFGVAGEARRDHQIVLPQRRLERVGASGRRSRRCAAQACSRRVRIVAASASDTTPAPCPAASSSTLSRSRSVVSRSTSAPAARLPARVRRRRPSIAPDRRLAARSRPPVARSSRSRAADRPCETKLIEQDGTGLLGMTAAAAGSLSRRAPSRPFSGARPAPGDGLDPAGRRQCRLGFGECLRRIRMLPRGGRERGDDPGPLLDQLTHAPRTEAPRTSRSGSGSPLALQPSQQAWRSPHHGRRGCVVVRAGPSRP